MLYDILIPILIFIGLGLIAGILLSVFSKIFAVKTDERVEKITEALPGINCGACGFKGCENYANEIVYNNVKTNRCVPGGDATSQKISDILGKSFEDVIERVAYVSCNGKVPEATLEAYDYQGEQTCAACSAFYKGKGICNYSCLGFGDCVAQCKYDAISVVDGVAVIDPEKCIGCELCAKTCPKHIIHMRDQVKKVFVACSSCDNGKTTNQKCKNGCIACRLCEKNCPTGAITVENNLAHIDYEKCIDCLKCVEVCPKHCIHSI